MGPNFFLVEKATESHRQELLQQAEMERLLAQLPRQSRNESRDVAGKFAALLLRLGGWLRQFGQKSLTMLKDHP
jgi:hypothetical protein